LAQSLQTILDAPVIELDTIDSTNNYAMQLIDADTAQYGLTILAKQQTKGKGQRGRQWIDQAGHSLLTSIICCPQYTLDQQFAFSAAVATAIADVLTQLYEGWNVCIKWPNDIIINDKKAGGILIENVLRGNIWTYAIIGLGLNISQESFPLELPFATSLKIASGKNFSVASVFASIREGILRKTAMAASESEILDEYNTFLYRKGCRQIFTSGNEEWSATVFSVQPNGTLLVQEEDGRVKQYSHGTETWKWQ